MILTRKYIINDDGYGIVLVNIQDCTWMRIPLTKWFIIQALTGFIATPKKTKHKIQPEPWYLVVMKSDACHLHISRHNPVKLNDPFFFGGGYILFLSSLHQGFTYPIGSMYVIYGNIYHQYTPNVSIYIYIYHTWILWVPQIVAMSLARGDLSVATRLGTMEAGQITTTWGTSGPTIAIENHHL